MFSFWRLLAKPKNGDVKMVIDLDSVLMVNNAFMFVLGLTAFVYGLFVKNRVAIVVGLVLFLGNLILFIQDLW
ncbi:MAG TPA: hypothetical protein PK054_08810 [Anaerohalosphaeraceae bacterium]|nr:hypothetical protein [Anaerohalosphaeraceae bacterium]HOL88258.1 hypothetical protein [Anaerohalosphaeraceae bacterium]HPP56668.1 hypothetical protein [Anaerohalosphaeraceae bacterium]